MRYKREFPIFYLSLFSGVCGGDLAYQHLLGWRCVGYVEIERYCQQVIAQRIKDGFLNEAPIFSDIRDFINQGYAKSYKGLVDGITAGFPCQPFSLAGKRKGGQDKRNMWPATIECVRIIRPRFAFLENVSGLCSHLYIMQIFGDLAEARYNARWCVLGADDTGAPHKRKRLWILAYPNGPKAARQRENSRQILPFAEAEGLGVGSCKFDVAYSQRQGCNKGRFSEEGQTARCSWKQCEYWKVEPNVGRVAHGVANGVDRLKALGNGQVPAVAATAYKILRRII